MSGRQKFTHRSIRLFRRRILLHPRVVWCSEIKFYGVLSVVVIARVGLGAFICGNGTRAVTFRIVGISHLDVRPDRKPRRIDIAGGKGGLEIIDRNIVVPLF